MPLKLYFDQQVPKAIATGLRLRSLDVLTAFEDGASELDDAALLRRASGLGRVLFSQDDDLPAEASRCQQQGESFGGVVYVHQLQLTVGQCVNELELLATLAEPHEVENRVVFLPL